MTKVQQFLEDQLLPIWHDPEMLELLFKIRNSLRAEIGCKIFWVVPNWIFLPTKLCGSEERLTEHTPDISFGVFRVDNEGAARLLDEKVEVGRKFKLCEVDSKCRSHLPTKPFDWNYIIQGHVDTQKHTIFDGFRWNTELAGGGKK